MNFNLQDMAIYIIDTYENERVLIDELAAADSLQLNWDGGDDLYQSFMTSELVFSMAVTDNTDGKFKHLLTGDEKRFKVQLVSIVDETEVIIWQGYILPDLYSEPYKNGVLFVEFTAIDMLASLKGKYFKPWIYQRKINVIKLLSLLLQETGLEQQFMVKPMLINLSAGYQWRDLNISLTQYAKDDEYTDLYDILDELMTGLGMQLCSFNGYWILQGITRQVEFEGPAEIYTYLGEYVETVTVVNDVIAPLFENYPMITSETPWKKVNLNFPDDDDVNLFPDDVVIKEFYGAAYQNEEFVLPGFVTALMGYWEKEGAPYMIMPENIPYLRYGMNPAIDPFTYNVNEASAILNCIKCNYRPYVYVGRTYELEFDILMGIKFTIVAGTDILERLLNGELDYMFNFSASLNGVEIMSSRPSFYASSKYKFEKEHRGGQVGLEDFDTENLGSVYGINFTMVREFRPTESGYIDFKFLSPIAYLEDDQIIDFFFEPKVLKINIPDKKGNQESVIAARPINYTKELDIDVNMTCSVDSGTEQTFGIGAQSSPEVITLNNGPWELFLPQQEFEPSTEINMIMYRTTIGPLYQGYLFRQFNPKIVYLEKADGSQEHYFSLYTHTVTGQQKLGVYTGYVADPQGRPEIPDDYAELTLPDPADSLKAVVSLYLTEDINNRADWKIYGFPDASKNTYLKTYALGCHGVRPDVVNSIEGKCFSLVFPLQLLQFKYDGYRVYKPTRIGNNLHRGTCDITMKEAVITQLTDVEYE